MRIKDVIAQTDLTGRAIRLYIENELVIPDFGETNSGRRSINFSQEDVENLKKIATLRKAGFSIAEIKTLKNNENCKETVMGFIEKTSLRVETDTLIINSLQDLIEKDEITLDTVCQSLDAPTAEKNVPVEDIKPPIRERIEKAVMLTIAFISLTFTCFYYIVLVAYYKAQFLYPVLYKDAYLFILIVVTIVTLCIIGYILYLYLRRNRLDSNRKNYKSKSILCIISLAVFMFLGVRIGFMPFFIPIVYSQTTDPNDYLQLDHYVRKKSDYIYSLFPAVIPESAVSKYSYWSSEYDDSVIYFYRHNFQVEADFDIVAEWQLPDDEFKAEKERALEDIGEITHQSIKGDWNCIYYGDFNEKKKAHYYFNIFAYNENTKTVRYIISYSLEEYEPYYLSLDW